MILGGDIGGTKTQLGLFELGANGVPILRRTATLASAEFPDLAALVASFLGGDARAVEAACFGVPGPVAGDRLVARLPNLEGWGLIDGTCPLPLPGLDVELPPFRLRNDLVATAEGIRFLAEDELAVLYPGASDASNPSDIAGNQVLLAAGTGLGMAFLPSIAGRRAVVPSEGGHIDFAPRDELEAGLLFHLRQALAKRPGTGARVSVERVVSGPGLLHIYQYLAGVSGHPRHPAVEAALDAGVDAVPAISQAGLDGSSSLCRQCLELFVSLYGAAAGNLVLLGTASGGIFLGGGIAPKILPLLQEGPFLAAFFAKGRLEPYLRQVPVKVLLNPATALWGAAGVAAENPPGRRQSGL